MHESQNGKRISNLNMATTMERKIVLRVTWLVAFNLIYANFLGMGSITVVFEELNRDGWLALDRIQVFMALTMLALLVAFLLAISAIFLPRRKQWARLVDLILAWFFLGGSLICLVAAAFFDLDSLIATKPPREFHSWRIAFSLFGVALLFYSGLALAILLPDKVRAYFR